jgi:hypothetical protein
MFFLAESPRWIARFKPPDAAMEVLSKLRNLPSDHAYLVDEMYAITDQLEQERISANGKGFMAQLRELAMPGNRRRIVLGVLIFIFMQFASSNTINYYSP